MCFENEKSFNIVLDTVVLSEENVDGSFYVFLSSSVDGQKIVELHDKLYSNRLKQGLRVDMPYSPHITIGHGGERSPMTLLVDQLSGSKQNMEVSVNTVSVVEIDGDTISKVYDKKLL